MKEGRKGETSDGGAEQRGWQRKEFVGGSNMFDGCSLISDRVGHPEKGGIEEKKNGQKRVCNGYFLG